MPAGMELLQAAPLESRSGTLLGRPTEDVSMNDVTRILAAVEKGDAGAAKQLLPLVYDELRKLAAVRLADERPGQTLQATALVHEAYLRLVGGGQPQDWDGRGHFFAAAAEAMRRILVESARRKSTAKRGGKLRRIDVEQLSVADSGREAELLAIDDALAELERHDPQAAEVVRLRFYAGLPLPEVARVLGVSPRTADRAWAYARAWLHHAVTGDSDPGGDIP